jgi:dolichyl-phosphate-mannose-protein mannosyltransferase
LILLDAFLVFFTALTALMWSEFLRYKNEPFSVKWWRSLTLVGVALGLTVSVKWVGLFTITLIGVFTIGQLWSIITDGAIPLRTFQKHFMARVVTLIMIPCMIYLTCFRIHFAILNKTGPGSSFMSPEFQSGLGGSFAKESYLNVAYGSTVVLLHEGTRGGFLHSHPHNYPGGSKQQQITCYPHRDKNSDFLLKYPLNLGDLRNITEKPIVEFEKILHKQTIRLEHLATNLRLHSHDVRPTFTDDKEVNEVTAYGSKTVLGDANDHWVVEIEGGNSTTELHALNSKFRLRHLNTGCYLMSRTSKLPDWAFGQQEVTCSTKGRRDLTIWRVDSVSHPNMPEGSPRVSYTKPGFFKSFVQLHKLMWTSNKGLKGSHPYDSRPTEWPFMHRGIGFWRSTPDTKGIYLLGNPVVWLSATFAVLLYLGFIVVELVLEQRKISFQKSGYYKEMLLGIWFFAIGYLLHFLPFFLMGRQVFILNAVVFASLSPFFILWDLGVLWDV